MPRRVCLLVLLPLVLALPAGAAKTPAERLDRATEVYRELLNEPDRGVPEWLVEKARCVAVIPGVIKGALVWGGRHGRGVVSCRNDAGAWSAPSFVNITGGSWGLQIGAQKTDLVLFVMNERGAKSLVDSEFTLGGDAAVAAGPVGRAAQGSTDVRLNAEIFAYARSRGLFAGLSLEGSRLNAARQAIAEFYGRDLEPEAILFGSGVSEMPPAAERFVRTLP